MAIEFKFTPEEEAFRQEIREYLREELPADHWRLQSDRETEGSQYADASRRFVKKLAARGWLTMHWPEEYGGRGASVMQQVIYNEETGYHAAPTGVGTLMAVSMAGPTLMHWGSEELKQEHLPAIAAGDEVWCQGFSEPGSGSDLASLQTRAVRDGDDYVVNGQKIWTSGAHTADWCMLLVRTDPEARKHKGISYLLMDMRSPGITVKPIINMLDAHAFNEMWMEDVRVPRRDCEVVDVHPDSALAHLHRQFGEPAAAGEMPPLLEQQRLPGVRRRIDVPDPVFAGSVAAVEGVVVARRVPVPGQRHVPVTDHSQVAAPGARRVRHPRDDVPAAAEIAALRKRRQARHPAVRVYPQLRHRDEFGRATRPPHQSDAAAVDRVEPQRVAIEGAAVVAERVLRRDREPCHVHPVVALAHLNDQRFEPPAVAVVPPFLEEDHFPGRREVERVPDPVELDAVDAVIRVVLPQRVRAPGRRPLPVADHFDVPVADPRRRHHPCDWLSATRQVLAHSALLGGRVHWLRRRENGRHDEREPEERQQRQRQRSVACPSRRTATRTHSTHRPKHAFLHAPFLKLDEEKNRISAPEAVNRHSLSLRVDD